MSEKTPDLAVAGSGNVQGLPRAIPYAIERVPADQFENAIRKFGVINACEWFGHRSDSYFTAETIEVLVERSKADGVQP